jgi:uncharacterized membrane protein
MFFNGFTLLLIIISLIAGFAFGVRVQEAQTRSRASEWIQGETVEDHMKRDGWSL